MPRRRARRNDRMTALWHQLLRLDMHAISRAQDDIYGKWSTERSTTMTPTRGRRSRARQIGRRLEQRPDPSSSCATTLLPQRQEMTADDVIDPFTRIMDGKRAFPAARWVRIIKARWRSKGQANDNRRPKKIDDFTPEMTLTDRVDPVLFYNGNKRSIRWAKPRSRKFCRSRSASGRSSSSSTSRVHASLPRARRNSTNPACRTRTASSSAIMGEAPARDVAFRNKEIHLSILGPAQYGAIARIRTLRRHPRGRGGLHASHGTEPRVQALLRQARVRGHQSCDRVLILLSSVLLRQAKASPGRLRAACAARRWPTTRRGSLTPSIRGEGEVPYAEAGEQGMGSRIRPDD